MNKNVVNIILVIIGVLCILLAGYYWLTPANALLPFIPGYAADSTKIHLTHGFAALIVGAACLVYVWFQSGRKSASQKSQ